MRRHAPGRLGLCSRSNSLIALVVVAAAAGLVPTAAYAQRGGDYVGTEGPEGSPRKGFPGIFNTHMAEDGGVVVSAPLLQLDYGMSENVTVGLNLIPSLSVGPGYPPGAIGRLRFRLHSAGRVSSVATVMLAAGRRGLTNYMGGYASKAFGVDVATGHRLSASVFGLSLRRKRVDDRHLASAFGFSLDHDWFFNDRFGLNTTVVFSPVVRSVETGPFDELVQYGVGLDEQTFVRALAVIKPGRTWLLQVGGAAPVHFKYGIPWLEVSKRW